MCPIALMMGNPARQKGWMSRHGHVIKPGEDGVLLCPESGYRYREAKPGILCCLDLNEGEPLPPGLAKGERKYDDFKAAKAGA